MTPLHNNGLLMMVASSVSWKISARSLTSSLSLVLNTDILWILRSLSWQLSQEESVKRQLCLQAQIWISRRALESWDQLPGVLRPLKFSCKMQKINTEKVWRDLVILLTPFPRMPMHVWRRGFNRSWASSGVLHPPWTGFWTRWRSSLAESYPTSSAKK